MAIENADILNKEIPQTPTETPAPAGVSASGELEIDSWIDQPFGDSEEDQVLVAGLGNVARAIARPITTAIGIGKANMGDAVPENLRFKNLPKTEDDFFIKVDVNEALDRPIRVDGEKLDTPELRQDKIDELDSLLSQADYQDFDTTKSWQLNPQNITSAEDFNKAQMAIAKRYRVEIDKQRRGVVTEEEQLKLARVFSNDPEFAKKFMTTGPGTALSAEELKAARFLVLKSAENLKASATNFRRQATGDDLPVAELEFLRNWNIHKELVVKWMGARAEAGRSLRAISGQSIGDMKDLSQAHIDELTRHYGSAADVARLADQVMAAQGLIGVNKTVAAQKSGISKWGAAIAENMTGSILSGLSTFGVNFFGNGLMIGRHATHLAVAARLGRWTMGDAAVVEKGEAMSYLIGSFASFNRARQAFVIALRTGEPYGGTAKFEGAKDKAISATSLGYDPKSAAGAAINVYGHIARAPMERILGPTDALYKVTNEGGHWAQLAYRQAAKDARAEGLSAAEQDLRLQQYMANPDQDTLLRMKEFGEYQTFTNPLGEWGRSTQKMLNQFTLGRLLVPVFRTPAQIFKIGFLEDTPLGFLSQSIRKDLYPEPEIGKAQLSSEQMERMQMAQSRMTVGTMTVATIGVLAANGYVTGSGPKEFGARDATREVVPPRSFVVERDEYGNPSKYMSFDRLEPFSLQIGLMADFYEILQASQHMDLDESQMEQIMDVGAALTLGVYENTINKTYMRGINEAISATQDPERYLERWQASFINAQLPLSGIRRDIRKMIDPMMRTTETLLERLKNQLPYFSKDLPALVGIHGEYIPYDHLMNLPLKTKEVSDDPTFQEYNRLFEATRIPPVTKGTAIIGGHKLNAQQKHDFQIISRNGIKLELDEQNNVIGASLPSYDPNANWKERVKPKGSGVTFAGAIQNLMISDQYNSPMVTDYARVEMIKKIQNGFDRAAREFLKAENPEILDAVLLIQQNEARRMMGRDAADQAFEDAGVEVLTPKSEQPLFRN